MDLNKTENGSDEQQKSDVIKPWKRALITIIAIIAIAVIIIIFSNPNVNYFPLQSTSALSTPLSLQTPSTTTTAPTTVLTTAKTQEPAKKYATATSQSKSINVAALSNTIYGWGQGLSHDSQNRPKNPIDYQAKYGKLYNADFIKLDSKYIYLTFDEGYENGYTSKILDILKEKNAKAVFFITLSYAKNNAILVKRMIDEGHIIGNHSSTHPSKGMPSLSIKAQIQEIMDCHDYIKSTFGYTPDLFRFPNGLYSEQSLAIVESCNYKSVFWSFAYKDYDTANQPGEKESLELLTQRLHPGAIYLLHAVSKTNTDILSDFIDTTLAKGYVFASSYYN